jgi:hypothetical protein
VNRGDAKSRAKARPQPAAIENLGDFFDSHRPLAGIAFEIKAVDQPHRLGFDGIDDELLFGSMTTLLDLRKRKA